MTPAKFRKLALALDGVEEVPHMERQAFRTKRKIFATLGVEKRVNMRIEPAERREALMAEYPDTFFDLGGWTRAFGSVGIELAKVEDGMLMELLHDAWEAALPKAPKKAPNKKKKAKR